MKIKSLKCALYIPALLFMLGMSPALAAETQAQKEDTPAQLKMKPLPPVASLVPVPPEFQQRWILRGCDKGQMAFRFSRRFLMVSIPQGSKLFRLGGFGELGNGRYSLSMPGETSGLLLSSTGRMIQYFGDLKMSFSRDQLEARRLMIPHVMYDNCTAAPDVKVKEDPVMLALLPGLDHIQESCPAPQDIGKAACQESIFALFDRDNDKSLDETELHRAWDILIANSPFGTCGAAATAADSLRSDGGEYVQWLLTHVDENKDQRITFGEFAPQWKAMQSDPLMSGFTNLLIASDRTIGFLPEAIKVSCVNCCMGPR